MATFPRGFWAKQFTRNDLRIRRLGQAQTKPGKVHYHTAADSITLRGIPAIGRGVAGHIPGTRPDTHIGDQ